MSSGVDRTIVREKITDRCFPQMLCRERAAAVCGEGATKSKQERPHNTIYRSKPILHPPCHNGDKAGSLSRTLHQRVGAAEIRFGSDALCPLTIAKHNPRGPIEEYFE